MTTPPWIIGAGLLVWGLATGLWPLAVPMALILESAHVIRTRWAFTGRDIMRMSDLGTIMVIGFAVFFIIGDPALAIYRLVSWLPACFFPLAAVQVFHAESDIDIRYLFFVLRKNIGREENDQPIRVNLCYPFLVLCLIAAGATHSRNEWYYPALWIVCAWALWSLRSRRFHPLTWFAVILFCGATGFFAQAGMHRIQYIATDWYMRHFYSEPDPYNRQTAIGDIGALKPSDRIVFRIKSPTTGGQPILLREAAYDIYYAGTWLAGRHGMERTNVPSDGSGWLINRSVHSDRRLTIAMPLHRGRGLLKLPYGSGRIEDLPADRLIINRMGTLLAEEGPGLAMYQVFFDDSLGDESPPSFSDLSIPPIEARTLSDILASILPGRASPEEIVRSIDRYFNTGFRYTLNLERFKHGETAISDFLTNTRAGHCEYFATAAVLLLRAAGIPSRYATGYAAFETGRFGTWHVVRQRHAHAWAEAFVNGRWRVIDTTPSGWVSLEAEERSFFEPIRDLWSEFAFRIARWRWKEREHSWRRYLPWLLIPLTLYMARGLFRRKRENGKSSHAMEGRLERLFPGHDSEFFRLEAEIVRRGYDRRPGETYPDWFKRIGPVSPIDPSDEVLVRALDLHSRLRFDPRGIEPDERRRLADSVKTLMKELDASENGLDLRRDPSEMENA